VYHILHSGNVFRPKYGHLQAENIKFIKVLHTTVLKYNEIIKSSFNDILIVLIIIIIITNLTQQHGGYLYN
jgi:hypothetical protein